MSKTRAARFPEPLTNAGRRLREAQRGRVAEVHARLIQWANTTGADFERKRGDVITQADRLSLERGGQLLMGAAPIADLSVDDLWAIVAYAGQQHPTWR